MSLLREGLLEGRGIAAARVSDEVAEGLRVLRGRVELLDAGGLPDDEERVGEWARGRAPLNAVVFDARGLELTVALESAWLAVREVAVGALIPGSAAGKVVMLAPPDGPVCAGLENLARTLSVEWARHGITTATVAVAAGAQEARLAELVCFLCSGAGEYFSGCRLDLGLL